MSAHGPANDGKPALRTKTACSRAAGAAGLTGALVCGGSMVLAGLGVGAATTAVGTVGMARMAGMDQANRPTHGPLGLLVRVGPWLLIVSVVLVAVAFALRRPGAVIPALALLAGVVLYAGMYAQPNRTVMYVSIAVGYAGWAALYLWVRNLAFVREQGYPSHQAATEKEVHEGHHPDPGA